MNAQLNNQADTSPVAVIFRRDAAGNKVGFLKDSLDLSTEGGKIAVWHEGAGREVSEVPLSYYYATTKLEHHDILDVQNKFAEGYQPKFGIALKARLGKNLESHHSHPAQSNKSANETRQENRRASDAKPFDQSEYLAKMSVAITAAVKAALEAVNQEYAPK